MKKRMGFVSNSSSSSFICDITGTVEGGMDCCLYDVDMAQCVKGHTFLTGGWSDVGKFIEEDEDGDTRYEVPEELCPVCNGMAKAQIIARLKGDMKRLNITAKDIQ